jgi:hypothetical protein
MAIRCLKSARTAMAFGFLLVLATGAVQAEQSQPGPGTTTPSKPKSDLTCGIAAFVGTAQGAPVVDGQTISVVGETRKVVYIVYAKNTGTGRAAPSTAWDAFTVSNSGGQLRAGSTPRSVQALDPGEDAALPQSEITFRAGQTVLLRATMDGPAQVSESREDNNQCTLTFTGRGVSVPKTGSAAPR